MTKLESLSVALIALIVSGPCMAQRPKYHIAETYKLGVKGGYDYMAFDPASHLLYIAQGDQVDVFDPAKGVITGAIKGMNHTHGIVFDKDGVTGYISDGGAGFVQIFKRSDLSKLATITVGNNPDGMVIEPTTGHLFVFNGKSKNLSVVDLGSRKVIATVPLPGKPEFPTADGKGNVFVNIEDTHQVVKITAADNKAINTWTIVGCEAPSGMAIDTSAGRIFPVCDNGKMPVLDTASGKVVAMPAIGTGPDAAAYDAARHLLFASNGDAGTLSIVQQTSADVYAPLQTVKTSAQARTLALDTTDGAVYVIAPDPSSTGAAATKPLLLYKVTK